jgi:hypothetical protein
MAKPAKKRTNHLIANADDRATLDGVATLKNTDIARRAFELYCERGGQHGRDIEDWLRAETELRATLQSASPRLRRA